MFKLKFLKISLVKSEAKTFVVPSQIGKTLKIKKKLYLKILKINYTLKIKKKIIH